jgi:dihydroorotate dehydrogenase
MKDLGFKIKVFLLDLGYFGLAKPIFFLFDPEKVHDFVISLGKFLQKKYFFRFLIDKTFNYQNKILETNLCGIFLKNPIGLSAGFDKDGEIINIVSDTGFAFSEIGSVTAKRCLGNKGKRLWRLPKTKSLVVYYGLKNNGADEILDRLEKENFDIPVGVSVAMTNIHENADIDTAISDYLYTFKKAIPVANYLTLNISCPNITCGEEKLFLVPENLEKLLIEIDKVNCQKPVFVKLSPDLEIETLDKILNILEKHKIAGIICTNLTKKRDSKIILDKKVPEVGGLSGLVVKNVSDEMISYIYKKYKERFILIGVGGIFDASDVYKKMRLGASAVQIITGMIYNGPQVIGKINYELAEMLKKDGFKSVKEVVGIDSKTF